MILAGVAWLNKGHSHLSCHLSSRNEHSPPIRIRIGWLQPVSWKFVSIWYLQVDNSIEIQTNLENCITLNQWNCSRFFYLFDISCAFLNGDWIRQGFIMNTGGGAVAIYHRLSICVPTHPICAQSGREGKRLITHPDKHSDQYPLCPAVYHRLVDWLNICHADFTRHILWPIAIHTVSVYENTRVLQIISNESYLHDMHGQWKLKPRQNR